MATFLGRRVCVHRKTFRAGLPALPPERYGGRVPALRFGCRDIVPYLARQNSHDVDGVADHISGRFSPFGPLGLVAPFVLCTSISREKGTERVAVNVALVSHFHDTQISLILAAPELLAAAKRAVGIVDDFEGATSDLQAAIAAAGESPP